jgi:hypothetical protein
LKPCRSQPRAGKELRDPVHLLPDVLGQLLQIDVAEVEDVALEPVPFRGAGQGRVAPFLDEMAGMAEQGVQDARVLVQGRVRLVVGGDDLGEEVREGPALDELGTEFEVVETVEKLPLPFVDLRQRAGHVLADESGEGRVPVDDEHGNADDVHEPQRVDEGHHFHGQGGDLRAFLHEALHGQGHGQVLAPDGPQQLVDVCVVRTERRFQDHMEDDAAYLFQSEAVDGDTQIDDFRDAAEQR